MNPSRNRPFSRFLLFSCTSVALSALANGAFVINIDTFSDGAQSLDFTGTTGIITEPASGLAASILGSERESTFEVSSNPLSTTATLGVANPASAIIALGPSVSGEATFLYNGTMSAGLGGMDFTVNGGDAIGIDVSSNDQDLTIDIALTDLAGLSASYMGTISGGILAPQTEVYDYALFSTGAGFDWAQIDSIELKFEPMLGGDAILAGIGVLDNVPAVPEPSTGLLIMLATVGLSIRRKRTGR